MHTRSGTFKTSDGAHFVRFFIVRRINRLIHEILAKQKQCKNYN